MCTKIYSLALFTMIFTLSATNALAESAVYRWVDENGVVHFENQAPRQVNAEVIIIKSSPNRDEQAALGTAPEDTAEKTVTETSYAQKRRDERAMKRQEAIENEKLTAANCEYNHRVVAQLEPMPRVLLEQKDGTVVRMDDNDRLERLGEAKAYIAENCSQ